MVRDLLRCRDRRSRCDDAGLANLLTSRTRCVCRFCSLPAVAMLFIALGSGLFFSGIPILYENMSRFWYWCYYTSIPALTTRALVVNDLSGEFLCPIISPS